MKNSNRIACCALLLWMSGCKQSTGTAKEATGAVKETTGTVDEVVQDGGIISYPRPLDSSRKPENNAEMAKAFKVAYGQSAPFREYIPDDGNAETYPNAFFRLQGDLYIFIAVTKIPKPMPLSSGCFTLWYINRKGEEYRVVKKFPRGLGCASWGQPGSWRVRYDLDKYPILLMSDGDFGHGVNSQITNLVRLTPSGPVIASEPLLMVAGPDGDKENSATGKIVPDGNKNGFDILYSGHVQGTIHYRPDADGFYRPALSVDSGKFICRLNDLIGDGGCAEGDDTLPDISSASDDSKPSGAVEIFYQALHDGDGVKANAQLAPEKQSLAAYKPENIAKFYGSLPVPLAVSHIDDRVDGRKDVYYSYHNGTRICRGHALVTTITVNGTERIANIQSLSDC